MLTPSFTPRGEHYCLEEWRGQQNFNPGDIFTHGGQNSPTGKKAKLRIGCWAVPPPHPHPLQRISVVMFHLFSSNVGDSSQIVCLWIFLIVLEVNLKMNEPNRGPPSLPSEFMLLLV
jgi:hypothetical protein